MSNPYAAPQFSPEPTPEQPAPKKKKGGCRTWGAGAIAVFVLAGIAVNAGSDSAMTRPAPPHRSQAQAPRRSISTTL